jgi:sugar phosphate isomerase/epimerase
VSHGVSAEADVFHAKLALISLDFEDLQQLYTTAARRGIGWVEVFVGAIPDEAAVEWLNRQRVDHGIRVASVSSLAKLSLATDEELPDHVALVEQSIERARQLEAPCVTFMYGSQPHLSQADARDRFIRRLEPLTETAAASGVTILIENVFSRGCAGDLDSVEAVADLFERLDRDRVGLNFDPANLTIGGAEGYPHGYRTLKPFIRSIHLKDVRPLRDDDHPLGTRRVMEDFARGSFLVVPLGRGDLDVEGLLAEIRQDAPDIVISLEPTAQRDECADWLDVSLAYMEQHRIVGEAPEHSAHPEQVVTS